MGRGAYKEEGGHVGAWGPRDLQKLQYIKHKGVISPLDMVFLNIIIPKITEYIAKVIWTYLSNGYIENTQLITINLS